MTFRAEAQAFWLPKAGSTEAEYDDAYWPRRQVSGESCHRFAVADGATETLFSGIWARQLTRAYCKGILDDSPVREWLADLQQKWWGIVRRRPLPWYAEQKLESGTFAALVGVTLSSKSRNGEYGTWHARAIGDSCLFQIRGSSILAKFPLSRSEDFTNCPTLLSSKSDENAGTEFLVSSTGSWEYGDHFFLMTDAIAAWFIRAVEDGQAPWETVRDLDNDDDHHMMAAKYGMRSFRQWVSEARHDGVMRNDDVTLYRIEIE